jgi:hypothetical protein
MKGRRQVKEGFQSLEKIETWIVYVCHSEGEWARQNICDKNCNLWIFHAQQFPVGIKNGPPPKRYPANLTQLWEALESTWTSIPVERFRQ